MSETMALDLAHYPLQGTGIVNVRDLFECAYDVVLGTGPDSDSTLRVMRVLSYDNGYTLFARGDRWIAIRKQLISGSYRTGHSGKVAWVECEIMYLGKVAFLAIGQPDVYKLRLDKLARQLGIDARLIFCGGDDIVYYDKRQRTTEKYKNYISNQEQYSSYNPVEAGFTFELNF